MGWDASRGGAGASTAPAPRIDAGRLALGLAIAIAVAAVLATLLRLRFGVDFSDEAYYLALARRFALGDRPLLDEISPHQSGALLPALLFALRERLAPGTEGLVVFARLAWFFLGVWVWRVIHGSLRGDVGAAPAVLLGAFAVAFMPFNIPSLGYNTLGLAGFTAGCFLGAQALAGPPRARRFLAAGLAHGLAVLSYPTLLLPVLVWGVAIASAAPPGSRCRPALAALAGVAAPLVAAAPLLLRLGPDDWRSFLRAATSIKSGESPVHKLGVIAALAWSEQRLKWVTLPLAALIVVGIGRRWRPIELVAPALPLLFLAYRGVTPAVHAHGFLMPLGVLAPLLAPRPLSDRDHCLQRVVWLPAMVAGVTTAWTSTNATTNFIIGSFPAVVLACGNLARLAREGWVAGSRQGAIGPLAPLALVLGVLVFDQYRSVYRDDAIPWLSTRVASGPYRGLRTTPERAAFVARLEADVTPLAGDGVFYDSFPAGHLFRPGRPASNAVWIMSRDDDPHVDRTVYADYWRRRGRLPDFAVRMGVIPRSTRFEVMPRYRADDPVDALLSGSGYRLDRVRTEYRVYVRRGGVPTPAGAASDHASTIMGRGRPSNTLTPRAVIR